MQSVSQAVSLSVNQSVSQSVNQSVSLSVCTLTHQTPTAALEHYAQVFLFARIERVSFGRFIARCAQGVHAGVYQVFEFGSLLCAVTFLTRPQTRQSG